MAGRGAILLQPCPSGKTGRCPHPLALPLDRSSTAFQGRPLWGSWRLCCRAVVSLWLILALGHIGPAKTGQVTVVWVSSWQSAGLAVREAREKKQWLASP